MTRVLNINLMKWMVEVDINKTKNFYSKDIEFCDCLYCENYMEASKHVDSSVLEIFVALGIAPSKPSHLSEFGEMEK
ncbi:hypothetical protein [Salipaludibacillus neizhouensis]|uniref:hypothetical protein n=1 Tax=Salipaludibacillus neizhouensis TaxID=885475 RepID=UPI0016041D3C|nr:hypothetical protein [Salipaludibacillus neizhouensis]